MQAPGSITVKLDIDTTEAEAKLAALRSQAQALRGITVKVACPVCQERLEYIHEEGEAWGIISLRSNSLVELTTHDKGKVIEPHMQAHHADGSWAKVVRAQAEQLAALVKRLDELGK